MTLIIIVCIIIVVCSPRITMLVWLFDLMRKRCLQDYAMFAQGDNSEVTMAENPFTSDASASAEVEVEGEELDVES